MPAFSCGNMHEDGAAVIQAEKMLLISSLIRTGTGIH
jgi:hypothetical protein